MNFWKQFQIKNTETQNGNNSLVIFDVNAHLHTPYSFSAFESMEQIFQLAQNEGVKILGINDFNTTEGYKAWAEKCTEYKIFPLFNAEFIALSVVDQGNGITINDPKNPGRIYLSGKGMAFPFKLEEPYLSVLNKIQQNSNSQVFAMCNALNSYLKSMGEGIHLDNDFVMKEFTMGMIRERHLAKALRIKVFETVSDEGGRLKMLNSILGKEMITDLHNHTVIEGALRDKLLKSGGAAFIEETDEMFPDFEKVKKLILNGGGIPTYPLLADSLNGGFTAYEGDKFQLLEDLRKKGFHSVEFIPNRNSMAVLEEYSIFFAENGFIVTFGSEHNTPELIPLKLHTVNGDELSPILKQINYNGACAIAAHQYLVATTGSGYLDADGKPGLFNWGELIKLGDSVIKSFIE
jgi:hypothetical protein